MLVPSRVSAHIHPTDMNLNQRICPSHHEKPAESQPNGMKLYLFKSNLLNAGLTRKSVWLSTVAPLECLRHKKASETSRGFVVKSQGKSAEN
jgi:hypothetical protein